MTEIQQKLKKLGDEKKQKDLEEYVESLTISYLTSFVDDNLNRRIFVQAWNYLLQSFTNSNMSHEKRLMLTIYTLRQIDENNVLEIQSNEILMRLRLELPKFKPSHLVQIYDYCIEKIQNGNVLSNNWKELLPEIFTILVNKNCVTYRNVEMSGKDFKKQMINSICMLNWSTNIIIPLTGMFREIELSKEEHLMVVTKLCEYTEKLTSQELPTFTFQLLGLCSQDHSRCLFFNLQHYFAQRIYKNLGCDVEPSSDISDLTEISNATSLNVSEAESTILYHIQKASEMPQGVMKDYLHTIKTMLKAPEFVLQPFQLSVLLMTVNVSALKEQVLEIMRSCIVRTFSEEIKTTESIWFKEMISNDINVNNVISAIIDNSYQDRLFVVSGLIDLAFVLLGTGVGLGNRSLAEVQWKLGTFILLKLMKKKNEVSGTVIRKLYGEILKKHNSFILTDCLRRMCKHLKLIMLDHCGILIQFTDQILLLPGNTARYIIDAILPMIRFSPAVRDNIVVVLRKALFSRKIETQQTAVYGFLQLLQNLQISNLNTYSQSNSTFSQFSLLTQLVISTQTEQAPAKFSNEAFCLEILGILKRCFMQQLEVRTELYDGYHKAVSCNLELGTQALQQLFTHFKKYYVEDEDTLPPLLFTKTFTARNNEVVLEESLGHLIFAIGLIVAKLKDTLHNSNLTRYTDVLQSLCDRMAKCELIHFDLDTGGDLLDATPESQGLLFVLKQAISVSEALMGYLIRIWSNDSGNTAQQIYSLFQVYSRLIDFSKNLSKPKKAERRKKSKDDTCTQTVPLRTSKVFKPFPTVLDFQTTNKILSLLLEPVVNWATISQKNILAVKRDVHRYILRTILQLLQMNKINNKGELNRTDEFFDYCANIGEILLERIIKRLDNVIDFDCTTAVLGTECFYTVLSIVMSNFKKKLSKFISKISSTNSNEDLSETLMPLIQIFQEFIEQQENDYENDSEGKNLSVLLVNTYNILVLNLPVTGLQTKPILDWLKRFTNNNTVSNKQVGHSLILLLMNMYIRYKSTKLVFENIAKRLCNVMGTVNHDKPECHVLLNIVNEGTALLTLTSLTNSLKTMLNEVDWLIQRFGAEYNIITCPGADNIERRKELLERKEREICCDLSQIIQICMLVSNIAVPPGSQAEAIFKILIHLYSTLNALTKYFIHNTTKLNPTFQRVRFERVLQLAGKPLFAIVNQYIQYIVEDAELENNSTQNKKKSADPNKLKSKVLRETRSVPKLVYEMEQLGRNVNNLTKKTKIDLTNYIGLGTSRDYKIRVLSLKEALGKENENCDETDMNVETASKVAEEDNESNADMDELEQNSENYTPPTKKSRNAI